MTAAGGPDPYAKLVRRITHLIVVIGLVAGIATSIVKGPRFGLGLLLGAFLAWVSFWRWQKVVEAIGGARKRRSMWIWLLRLAALIAVVYVIVKYLEVTPAAVFIGLLVPAAAVIVSMIYELIHGT